VIDTGIDSAHEDITNNLWFNPAEKNGLPGVDDDENGLIDDVDGWDFYHGDNTYQDDNGHGSHVSGIIAGERNNQTGIVGIAPESTIMPIKVLSASGSGSWSDFTDAIRYAVDFGADIINLSLGGFLAIGSTLFTQVKSVIQYAHDHGTIIVAAAGNDYGPIQDNYPAVFDQVISVGALNHLHQRANFSSYGEELDFITPGVDVLSLRSQYTQFGNSVPGNTAYARASGTSMAAPVLAGVVALMLANEPLLTFDDIMRRLRYSSEDLGIAGKDNYYGYGLVDAFKALSYDFYDAGEVKSYRLAEPNDEGIVRFEYDLEGYDYAPEGRVVKLVYADNSYALIDHVPGTVQVSRKRIFRADGQLKQLIEYGSNNQIRLKQTYNFLGDQVSEFKQYEYDASGVKTRYLYESYYAGGVKKGHYDYSYVNGDQKTLYFERRNAQNQLTQSGSRMFASDGGFELKENYHYVNGAKTERLRYEYLYGDLERYLYEGYYVNGLVKSRYDYDYQAGQLQTLTFELRNDQNDLTKTGTRTYGVGQAVIGKEDVHYTSGNPSEKFVYTLTQAGLPITYLYQSFFANGVIRTHYDHEYFAGGNVSKITFEKRNSQNRLTDSGERNYHSTGYLESKKDYRYESGVLKDLSQYEYESSNVILRYLYQSYHSPTQVRTVYDYAYVGGLRHSLHYELYDIHGNLLDSQNIFF